MMIGSAQQQGPLFRDRHEAGVFLARELAGYAGRDDVIVLALPRGGVPVSYEVARALDLPLDVLIARKLGAPGHEELAIGAIAAGGVRVLNQDILDGMPDANSILEIVTKRELRELQRQEIEYRGGRSAPDLADKTVILIDDGLATGATMRAAVAAARKQQVTGVVVAVPVGALDTCAELRSEVDEIYCAFTPEPFFGVGMFYQDFLPVSDEDVRDLLFRAGTTR